MDAVYQELDEAKAETEKLREQYRVKTELAETLKRSHNDQVSENKEASFKLEKLAEELNEKEGEISAAKQMYDELKSNLAEKESIIKHITSAHDKLRLDCNEKLQKFEEENKALASTLDVSNTKNFDQQQQICALKQEVEGVKRLLNVSQKKCSKSESRTVASKDLGVREDAFFKLEEEKKKLEDHLKWKKEQFVHLEEAHEELLKQFKTREKEWEKERGELLYGISTLETKLESQIRISQDLQHRLEMCNNALAHAETKRKDLEVQLLESRTSLHNVCTEYDEAKLKFDNLATQRDQEIATLRSSLGTKDILYKEMDYQFRKLEQEKQELLISLKEHQGAQIRELSFSSSSKMQNKLKTLGQVHKGCSTNLKAKESEWRSQMEKLLQELDYFRSEVESKDSSLNELNRELEACDSLTMKLELLNQETSLMLLVLKSEFSEARLRLGDDHSCTNLKDKQMEENMYELMQQLEQKKTALISVQEDIEEERKKVVTLSKKVQTLEELQFPLQKEVDRHKEMLKESTSSRLQSKEQMLLIQDDLNKAREALERAEAELYEKFHEANEIEFELRIWKSVAEQLEAKLKQNHQMRKEVEASLLTETEVELNLKQEKQSLSHQLEEKEREINDLHQQLIMKATIAEAKTSCWNAKGDSLDQVDVRKKSLQQLVEEKDQIIGDLQQLVASLEHEIDSSTTSYSSRLSQMQRETNVLRESWDKIKADGVLKEVEIQENNIVIVELDKDLHNLTQSLEKKELEIRRLGCKLESKISTSEKTIKILTEKSTTLSSENNIVIVELDKDLHNLTQSLEKKELEIRRLGCKLESKISTSEKTIKILTEKSTTLSSENQFLMNTIGLLSEKMNKFTAEELQLMERLGNTVKSLPGDEEQENINIFSSPTTMKKVEAIYDERSPLRTIF